MHAYADAEKAALRAELERLKTVPMKYRRMAFNAQLQTENAALREALTHIERVMGPTVPPCCDGCHYEWGEALKTVRAALGEKK